MFREFLEQLDLFIHKDDRVNLSFKINETADPREEKLYGVLAYISKEDRMDIFNSGFGELKRAEAYLKKEVAKMKKKQKQKKKIGKPLSAIATLIVASLPTFSQASLPKKAPDVVYVINNTDSRFDYGATIYEIKPELLPNHICVVVGDPRGQGIDCVRIKEEPKDVK